MKISVVLPSLNEEAAVARVIGDVYSALGRGVEIIVVDAGTDRTAEIADSLGARVLRFGMRGYGNQIRHGFHHATGDVIVTADCDGTYPLSHLPELMRHWRRKTAITCDRFTLGSRHVSSLNRHVNGMFSVILRLLFAIDVKDVTTGMKILDADFVRSTSWRSNWSLPVEILIRAAKAGQRIVELPIPFHERLGGVSKLRRFSMGMAYLRCILKEKLDLDISEDLL